jgi:hypothetical protein
MLAIDGQIKRKFLAITLLLVLLLSPLVASLFVNLARANPFHFPIDNNPDPDQPLINVTSPNQNRIYNVTDIWLTFTVTKPQKWFGTDRFSYLGTVYNCNGEITFVRYSLDGKQSENFSANDDDWNEIYRKPMRRTLNFSFHLTGLSEGKHTLIVDLEGKYRYLESDTGIVLTTIVVANSTEIQFTVDTVSPHISVLSPRNETYLSETPLNFTVNEPVSQMVYSLDGKDNVTVVSSITLTGLSVGEHKVTIYATDLAGHSGASETITFTIAEPFPTVAVASGASVATVGVALLVYFKKRKH